MRYPKHPKSCKDLQLQWFHQSIASKVTEQQLRSLFEVYGLLEVFVIQQNRPEAVMKCNGVMYDRSNTNMGGGYLTNMQIKQ